jgi:CspA family cold shock protein
MSSVVTSSATASSPSILGRVKWFNNKAGYGFITVTDGPRSGTDIFVHHSAISVMDQQYKYLVQGEYVEFSLVSTQGGAHEFNAGNVSGVKGGKLMCETRLEFKNSKTGSKISERFGAVFDEIAQDNDSLRFKRPAPIHISPRHNRHFSDDSQDWSFGKSRNQSYS